MCRGEQGIRDGIFEEVVFKAGASNNQGRWYFVS